jgi:prolyl oligopeptidase
MRRALLISSLPLAVLACQAVTRIQYPPAPAGDVVETLHGVQVADPYRWLEEPDAPATRRWIEAENRISSAYLAGIPERAAIHARMTELWDFERTEIPQQEGERVFYRRNDGLQNQSVLYVSEGPGGAERVLLDPNALSDDGTIALMSFDADPQGALLAYSLSDGGSDWRTWKVRDVQTGRDLPDLVTRNKFGGMEWAADSTGFFYTRFDRPTEGTELQARNAPADVCFHRLGTSEAADVIVARRPEAAGRSWSFRVSEDGGALFLLQRDVASRKNEVSRLALARDRNGAWVGRGEPEPLITGFDASSWPIGSHGSRILLQTDWQAPRGRIVGLDPESPSREHWVEIVPQADETIRGADAVGDMLIVSYMVDARSIVRLFDLDGEPLGAVQMPVVGTASGFRGDADDRATYYSFESYTQPPTIYRFELSTRRSTPFRPASLGFEPADYLSEQVFYQSADGTRVPMFVTRHKDTRPDGKRPTILYGYGGFGISITPSFSVPNLVWMERGGVLAVPNLRGGGEYGEAWHEAGTKQNKQNVFDDFIAAAEWLIASGWTNPAHLAISGRSNGGLLVGATMTQRPELFGATLPAVGVLDMLRYHRFTIGWAWAGDYGTVEDEDEFHALLAYSPLHNVRAGTSYPPTLVTTADHDDRVVPAHSYKFTAALQAAQAGDAPILIRVDVRAGHGAGKPTAMRIDEEADKLAFLTREIGH